MRITLFVRVCSFRLAVLHRNIGNKLLIHRYLLKSRLVVERDGRRHHQLLLRFAGVVLLRPWVLETNSFVELHLGAVDPRGTDFVEVVYEVPAVALQLSFALCGARSALLVLL